MFTLSLSLCASFALAVGPLADLGYASYQGTSLENGVSQWLGIRYAAAPVGNLRFRAPAPPPTENVTQLANAHGPLCLETGFPDLTPLTSEDCLFLDIYAPTQVTDASTVPVYFFVQGGGFALNSDADFNGTGLVVASDFDMVVVTFNYRVGIFGFLASSEIEADGSLNAGLLDQRQALEWIHQYIQFFGGDSNRVVLGGVSAGAMSVLIHLTAYGGEQTNLFHAAAAESQGFFSQLNVSQSQFLYDNVVSKVGCGGKYNTLQCLRETDVAILQGANQAIPYQGRQNPPLYVYLPVTDGELLPDLLAKSFSEGKFVDVPVIFGDDTNEGSTFVPSNLVTQDDMDNWLQDQFPFLTTSIISEINQLYPQNAQVLGLGDFVNTTSAAYGDLFFVCSGVFASTAMASRSRSPVWVYWYNVVDPIQELVGLGVPHTVEVNAIWGPNNTNLDVPTSYFPGGINANIVPLMQSYWTSFVRAFDPNAHRIPGSAEWESIGQGRVLKIELNDTGMVEIPSDLQRRCDFFSGIAESIQQ